MNTRVELMQLPHGTGLPLPRYETEGSAGMDLSAAIAEQEPLVLPPGGRALVPTALVLALPRGVEAQIRPRSGLALRHGVTVLNAPGTIDSDYRGEVQVLLINHGTEPFTVTRGMRVAQMVIARHEVIELQIVDVVSPTARGAGGFGSTGAGSRENQ